MTASVLALIGGWEWVVIILAILLLFGGKKIPELMRGLGRGVSEFKKGMKDEENGPKEPEKDKKED
ncbi:MAG TPA: twin-arginine translocase TatA/TatE family subunit [Tenuifilaceae bacterium]|jgi:sec-independent protein translocase protein TatA|nr:twin-arginine translocase TatA/TatE family subunit [Bacteroidales bacterium]HNT41379.1 twin-arginine translocase TatA/TatE family subunit [Tenuifilaceae bacterium]MBP8644437.1 twin-arginine translocase TatA/TatE family subunit [Bacteroidales bacterium]HNY09136.1 twin-arginine translocase TatA/TatE family subunit [Tenuifilaceae bacterium]HOA10287.1 twin-arginine translocase TatA/TatE family subunit [Tenuifilaceae bacterium]